MKKELVKAEISFEDFNEDEAEKRKIFTLKEFSQWEVELERYETEIMELSEHYSKLQDSEKESKENKFTLDLVQVKSLNNYAKFQFDKMPFLNRISLLITSELY